jgi:iron(III) transport system permease protein
LLVSPGWLIARFAREIEGAGVWNTLAGTSDAIWNTLLSASFSAAFCTLGALALCLAWREWPHHWRGAALRLVVVPGLFAPVVIGVALIEWFNTQTFGALYDSRLGMVLWGHFARFFPVAIALLWPATARLNADAIHAAQGLGASPFRAAWSVAVPMLRTHLAGTFAVLWAACAGELTVSVLVHGPGGDTLTLPIFNFLHAGIASDVATLALVLMLGCGAAMAVAGVLSRLGARRV